MCEPLDLLEQRCPLCRVVLIRLPRKEVIHIRVAAVHVGAIADHEVLDAQGRVAKRAAGREHERVRKSSLPPLLEKRRSLDQAQFRTDADYAEIVHHGLAEIRGGRFAVEVAGIESVGIAGFGEVCMSVRARIGMPAATMRTRVWTG